MVGAGDTSSARGEVPRARRAPVAGLAALVVAVNAVLVAGLPSPPPASAAVETLGFAPTADARVSEARPTSNYATSHLRADGGSDPDIESYVRFDLAGLDGTIVRATLRLHAFGGTRAGFDAAVAASTWSESTITWSSRPASAATPLDSSGPVSTGAWAELDVTAAVTGDGPVTFVLRTASTDGTELDSREAEAAARPQLVVEVDRGSPPSNVTAPSVRGLPIHRQPLSASPGSWAGSPPITFTYQWERCDAAGFSCSPIAGATRAAYEAAAEDVGSTLRVAVTATNGHGVGSARSAPTDPIRPAPSEPVTLAGAGNVAGCDQTRDDATSGLLDGIGPDVVFTLGDNAYPSGTPEEYAACYDPSWGRHRPITTPAPGNHDYDTPGAAGYFGYFGAAAGDPARGYYAYDAGTWRVYVLNTACAEVGCGAGSAQESWLRDDFDANPRACTAVLTHEPRFSSAASAADRDNAGVAALYAAFDELGGDLWVAAHIHHYERLTRLDPSGSIDLAGGVRSFVAGTGGAGTSTPGVPFTGSEARVEAHGVLRLDLAANSYSWQFVTIGGQVADAGSDDCGPASPDTTAPSAPPDVTATAAAANAVTVRWSPSTDDRGVVAYEIRRDGVPIATTTAVTGYTDEAVTTGATYAYEVVAVDAAGNRSAPGGPATITVGGAPEVAAFGAEADARVAEARPSSNYGSSHLRTDGGADPDIHSYLRFRVTTSNRPVQRAVLRIRTFGASADGFDVRLSPISWDERTITWSNRPAPTTGPIAASGRVLKDSWVELDVTAAVTGPGTFAFVLQSISDDGVEIYSREAADASLRPQLVVTLG